MPPGLPDRLIELLVAGPPLVLLAAAAVPTALANAHPRSVRAAVTGILAVACAAGVAAAGLLVATGGLPVDRVLVAAPAPLPLNVGIFFDALTAVMTLLIGGVGLVIARFAARALDGEPGQGRFFIWLAFTIGAVLLLVAARNLLLLTAAWMLMSLGLHKLLIQYPERPWAVWAARKKFLVSRLGDLFLLVALGLVFARYGSFDYATLFAEAAGPRPTGAGWLEWLTGLFLVLGAMTKSAQVPFHSWLPDTMEAPTPVSALMHAGIINAGGFLVIRLSPLVSQAPLALDLLALVGAITALFGGLVMLTQTSIKRALAFSTIAQMGFMMLQCGLGGFAAAVLHIVAHSLSKAHAFLASGSVLEAAARLDTPARPASGRGSAGLATVAALALAGGICLTVFTVAGIDPTSKPGGLALTLVLALALATLLRQSLLAGSVRVAGFGILAAAAVAGVSLAALLGTERILAGSAVAQGLPPAPLGLLLTAVVVAGFGGVFVIQAATPLVTRLPAIRSLHVHAANGFYLDIPARRLTARVWGLSDPVP